MQHARYTACFLVVASAALVASLAACSSDDGRPSSDATGPGTGTGTGGGKNGGAAQSTVESTTPPSADGGASGAEGGTSTAKKANGEGPCQTGADCVSGVCFAGNSQSYCSLKCTADNAVTVCVAPFTGSCNKQGYCKRD